MKQDQRSKTARVAAVLAMAKERGRPVTRQAARKAVNWRAWVHADVAKVNLYSGPIIARAALRSWINRWERTLKLIEWSQLWNTK